MKNIKKISLVPKPSRLISTLTQVGYELPVAIADIVDNSIQADASEIAIDVISKDHGVEPCIYIYDNGKGMNFDEMKTAMTFASDKEYSKKDLGKFGLGLKTASLSQCNVLTVCSRPKPQHGKRSVLNICEWDRTEVYVSNKWNVLNPKYEALDDWKKEILSRFDKLEEGGTLIIWSEMQDVIKDLYSEDFNKRKDYLAKMLKKTEEHLSIVFHKFIQNQIPGKKKVKIYLSENELDSFDPFCVHEKIQQPEILNLTVNYKTDSAQDKKSKIVVTPYILPREDQFSSPKSYKEASRIKTWHQMQGFYFYRNHRLLSYGNWSGLARVDKKNILLRVAVNFNENLDKDFKINISKEKAFIPDKVSKEIEEKLSEWIDQSRKRWNGKRDKGKDNEKKVSYVNQDYLGVKLEITNNGNKIIVKRSGKDKTVHISIPKKHSLGDLLKKKRGKKNSVEYFCHFLILMIEAVKNNKLKKEHIPLDQIYKEFERIKELK